MATELPASDLRALRAIVTGLLNGKHDAKLSFLTYWTAIAMRLDRAIEATPEYSKKVFSIRFPLTLKSMATKGKHAGETMTMSLCPLLNVYGSLENWQRSRLYEAIDIRIMAERPRWPGCAVPTKTTRRGVRVTRASSQEPDEASVDVFAKVHVDRLVLAGILAGDTRSLLAREARWEKASPGKGSLLVDVYELK